MAVSGVDWSEGHKVSGGLKESGGRGTGEHRANEGRGAKRQQDW